jgi:hypothetical protein
MASLSDPELINKLKEKFPEVYPLNLREVFKSNDYQCYNDVITSKKYLYDIGLDVWLSETTELWRGIPID